MKRLMTPITAPALTLVLVLGIRSTISSSSGIAQRPPDHTVSKATVDRWMTELSNWGRWGKDDERGTLNLLTPETRKRALAAAKDGLCVGSPVAQGARNRDTWQ